MWAGPHRLAGGLGWLLNSGDITAVLPLVDFGGKFMRFLSLGKNISIGLRAHFKLTNQLSSPC